MRVLRFFKWVGLAAGLALAASGCSNDEAPVGQGESNLAEHGSAAPIGPEPSGDPTQYPIVLVHGFKASPEKDGFWGIAEALQADGHKVYVARTPPFQSADVRATYLQETVDQ